MSLDDLFTELRHRRGGPGARLGGGAEGAPTTWRVLISYEAGQSHWPGTRASRRTDHQQRCSTPPTAIAHETTYLASLDGWKNLAAS